MPDEEIPELKKQIAALLMLNELLVDDMIQVMMRLDRMENPKVPAGHHSQGRLQALREALLKAGGTLRQTPQGPL